ncbi:hypothetical protein ATEIFO6365_0006019300 [Aspergillus terreus]|uniref:Uncharacterized protein n=1 Tax=Aspergillus terreus TaxID=33178 RepID=A0A5M3Z083_ASPTE|nr:hypothetical protein ATETN484_0005019100 [Aspergillus terreus]GFF16856.1 hypothetical protein ATEIFO6365_0006019300 [Aspergillus terreus]
MRLLPLSLAVSLLASSCSAGPIPIAVPSLVRRWWDRGTHNSKSDQYEPVSSVKLHNLDAEPLSTCVADDGTFSIVPVTPKHAEASNPAIVALTFDDNGTVTPSTTAPPPSSTSTPEPPPPLPPTSTAPPLSSPSPPPPAPEVTSTTTSGPRSFTTVTVLVTVTADDPPAETITETSTVTAPYSSPTSSATSSFFSWTVHLPSGIGMVVPATPVADSPSNASTSTSTLSTAMRTEMAVKSATAAATVMGGDAMPDV